MAVSNGQRANQETFNDAFVSRTQNSDTVGIVGLNHPASGGLIANAQQKINDNESAIIANANSIATLFTVKQDLAEKNQPNGYAGLDASGKLLVNQLPFEVVTLEGNWDASTNTPVLIDGTGDLGQLYVVNVAGTQDLGSGSQTFALGDWIVYDSQNEWKKVINSNAVRTVNGQVGDVVLNLDDIADVNLNTPVNGEILTYDSGEWVNSPAPADSLDDLTDVTLTAPANGEVLTYNGTEWVNSPAASGGANTALDNLTTTSINQALRPNADFGQNLGQFTQRWDNVFAGEVDLRSNNVGNPKNILKASDGSGAPEVITFQLNPSVAPGNSSLPPATDGSNTAVHFKTLPTAAAGRRDLIVQASQSFDNDANPSGSLFLASGNKSDGTGDSGDVVLSTGLSVGGLRGKARIDARSLNLPQAASDPSGGSDGDLYFNTVANEIRVFFGGVWNALGGGGGGSLGGYQSIQVFETSGTWTKPVGLYAAEIEVVGGGGGGGGCVVTAAGQASEAGSGGGGGFVRKFFLEAALPSSVTVTIGAGGTAGPIGTNGGIGGNSSFGALLTANGGSGGTGSTFSTGFLRVFGGAGGSGFGSPDILVPGGRGGSGGTSDGQTNRMNYSGESFYSKAILSGAGSGNGLTPTGYGGGGTGGRNAASQATGRTGGAGGPGIVIVKEYF